MARQGIKRLADDNFWVVCRFLTLREPDCATLYLNHQLDPFGCKERRSGRHAKFFAATMTERVQLISKHLNLFLFPVNNQAKIKANFIVGQNMKGYFNFDLTADDSIHKSKVPVKIVIISVENKAMLFKI